MEKQILNRGYITYMLTDEEGKIYGTNNREAYGWESYNEAFGHRYYWSECYVEPEHMAMIVRKGQLLVNPTPEEIEELFQQSKVNYRR